MKKSVDCLAASANGKAVRKGGFFYWPFFRVVTFLLRRFKFGSEDEGCWWKFGGQKKRMNIGAILNLRLTRRD